MSSQAAFRFLLLAALPAAFSFTAAAQQTPAGALNRSLEEQAAPQSASAKPQRPRVGALAGQSGVSLQTDEAVFTLAAGLNACGYDAGLSTAAPVRLQVRQEMQQQIDAGPDAAKARDALCEYFKAHDLGDPVKTLSQYISLSLMLAPGPELKLDAPTGQLPPDAAVVAGVLPLLRQFAAATQLHAIWISARPAYEALVDPLRAPLTNQILALSVYLRQTESGNQERRFLVIAEPMLGGGVVSARIYGLDYLLVLAPPSTDEQQERFREDVRHFFLEFAVDPVLFGYPRAMERLEPILRIVREAPLDSVYRDDISSFVAECLIRAIEARTMDTGIAVPKAKPGDRLSADEGRRAYALAQQDEAIRVARVERDEQQGFILTRYFYEKLGQFQSQSETLRDALGEMVYGIDPDLIHRHYQHFVFNAAPAPAKTPAARPTLAVRSGGLTPEGGGGAPADLVAHAEQQIAAGDIQGAAVTARQALDKRQGDPGRATYVLAQSQVMSGDAEAAEASFAKALTLTHDPHTLAWSHIYLGRIADLQQDRPKAVAEYKAALGVKSGLADADAAAQRGIREAFAPPAQPQPESH